MPKVWNTHLERQTFDHLVNATIMHDDSTVGAAIKLVVEYRAMIYGKAQVERRVYGEDVIIQDLPGGTEPEFRFRKHDLQSVAHLV
jgi:hypothetical protein